MSNARFWLLVVAGMAARLLLPDWAGIPICAAVAVVLTVDLVREVRAALASSVRPAGHSAPSTRNGAPCTGAAAADEAAPPARGERPL